MNINIEDANRPEAVNRYTIQRALEELDALINEHNAVVAQPDVRVPVYVSEPEPEPQPAEPDPEPKESLPKSPKLENLLEGYCYKQKPTLTSQWPRRYMVLFQVGGEEESEDGEERPKKKEIKLYFYNNKDEADKESQSVAQGVETVQRGSSITDLTLYDWRKGVEKFPTLLTTLDTIILEKRKKEEGESNNIVSLAFRKDMDGWVQKDDLSGKLERVLGLFG